jgi:hypothetical protein
MHKQQFWFLDTDPEGPVYENLSWDMPGVRLRRRSSRNNLLGRTGWPCATA